MTSPADRGRRHNDPLDAALDQLTEGVIVADSEGRITYVNAAAARLHGVARLDVPVDAYADTYHLFTEDGRPYPSVELPLARAVLRGETVVGARWRIRRPDGSERLVVGDARPLLGDAGAQTGAVLTLRDETPRAAAERELAASEMRFRAVQEHSPDGFMLFRSVRDAGGAIVDFAWSYVNPAAERMVGRSGSDLVGRHLLVEMPGNRNEGLFDAYVRVVETGEPWTREFTYRHEGLDGAFRSVAVRVEDGFGVTFSDVGERHRAEVAVQRARAAAEQAAERIGLLQEATAVLATARTPDEVARDILALGVRRLGARHGTLALVNADRTRLAIVDTVALPEATRRAFAEVPLDMVIPLSEAARTGRPVWVERRDVVDARYPDLRETVRELGVHAIVALPLMRTAPRPHDGAASNCHGDDQSLASDAAAVGDVLGALVLDFATDRVFDADDRALFEAIARHCAQALERAQRLVVERTVRERLRLATEVSGIGTWDFDLVSGALVWDARCRAAFGLPAHAPVDYSVFLRYLHPADRARTDTVVQAALDPTGTGTYDVEYRTHGPDGVTRWIQATGQALFAEKTTDDGQSARHAVRFIGTVLDVTARRAAEQEAADSLHALAAELARHNEELQEQGLELELSHQQLQDQTAELEAQHDELAAATEELAERTHAAEQTAEALRRSEERYVLAAEATRNAIWDWDLDTNLVRWNAGVYEIFGYAPGAVVETAAWWYEHIHPDDRDHVVTGIHAVIDDPAGGTAWSDAYRYRRGDGSYADVLDRGYVARDAAGRSVRMIGAMQDVTEQRRLEADARATTRRAMFAGDVGLAITTGASLSEVLQLCCTSAVERVGVAAAQVWVTEPGGDGSLTLVAHAGLEPVLDGERAKLPLGQLETDRIATDRRSYLTNTVVGDARIHDQAWARREGLQAFAGYPLMVGDEVVGVFALFARDALTDADRGALSSAATALSVTIANARLLETESRARVEAETANRAKSDFLAAMSHELRTPLNAIQGYADLLSLGIRGRVTSEQQEDLGRIKRSGQHLLTVINDILQYAKLEAGQLAFDIAAVPIDAALAELAVLIEPQLRTRALLYDYVVCDRGLTARADRDKLQQIVLNLLTNAVKFTAPGGRVTLACAAVAEGVAIRVADTGIGIPSDKLEHIFDPFVQVERKLSSPREGVGLGLAISRDLARGMGGDLTVESMPGAGSTFWLVLPRA